MKLLLTTAMVVLLAGVLVAVPTRPAVALGGGSR
jgi:hypothetical protein